MRSPRAGIGVSVVGQRSRTHSGDSTEWDHKGEWWMYWVGKRSEGCMGLEGVKVLSCLMRGDRVSRVDRVQGQGVQRECKARV